MLDGGLKSDSKPPFLLFLRFISFFDVLSRHEQRDILDMFVSASLKDFFLLGKKNELARNSKHLRCFLFWMFHSYPSFFFLLDEQPLLFIYSASTVSNSILNQVR